jgi:hypothetical protein
MSNKGIFCLLGGGSAAFALTFLAASAVAGTPFVPNDPYYSLQWNLDKQATGAVVDAGVAGAWADGWTGQGVRIGIVDASLFQTTHADLAGNYSSEFDLYQYNPSGDGGKHSTAVAGIAAARGGNGIGVAGAAPNARLSALSVNYSSSSYDASVAQAVRYRNDAIQIKNYSFGLNGSTSPSAFTSQPQTAQALAESDAAGTINVRCAHNTRENANKFGDKNLPSQIVVGAVGSNGTFSDYSNYGANLTVCAPSSTNGGLGITTTDLTGGAGYNGGPDTDYTSTFSGTSAATPLVSGILALAKEAQPNLDTRLAKHLLAKTSRVIDPDDSTILRMAPTHQDASLIDTGAVTPIGGWHTNAAGIHFNNNYGFGLIDAAALCDAAQEYSGVTPLVTESTGTLQVGALIGENGSLSRTFTLADPCHLEEISFDFSMTGTYLSSIEMVLTSPSGTVSVLLDSYVPPAPIYGTRNWTVLTNAFWGEDAAGTWTVTFRDLPWNNAARWPTRSHGIHSA